MAITITENRGQVVAVNMGVMLVGGMTESQQRVVLGAPVRLPGQGMVRPSLCVEMSGNRLKMTRMARGVVDDA